jgi:hypothetical protein
MNRRKFVIRASRLLVATPSVIDPSEAAFNKFPAKAPSHSFLQRLATSRKTQSHKAGHGIIRRAPGLYWKRLRRQTGV